MTNTEAKELIKLVMGVGEMDARRIVLDLLHERKLEMTKDYTLQIVHRVPEAKATDPGERGSKTADVEEQ